MTEHAYFSASAAHRWIKCPASLKMCEGVPKTTSPEAEYGTLVHDIAAKAILGSGDMRDYTNRGDVIADGQEYVDFVLKESKGCRILWVEHRVDFSSPSFTLENSSFGTADAAFLKGDTLTVVDLKTGYTDVDPENNPQLMLYAFGFLRRDDAPRDLKGVSLVIAQPKSGGIKMASYTVAELLDWYYDLSFPKMLAADIHAKGLINLAPTPGEEQCRYCPAKTFCKAYEDLVFDFFDDLDDERPLSEKLAHVPFIRNWCDAIEKEASARALNGEKIKGFKLVKGRAGNRTWIDEDEAKAYFKASGFTEDDFTERKIISPAKAEKDLKLDVSDLVDRREGSLTLVSESDKREAVTIDDSIYDI